MIKKYFVNYFERLKHTKKVAREKNVHVWAIPVFDSLLITVMISWEMSLATWILLDHWQNGHSYRPWYMESLWELSTFAVTAYMVIITLTILDKIILVFIYIHSYLNKLVFYLINRADMYIWKKTGRDSVFSNVLWRIQRKFMSRSKKQRRIILVGIGVLIAVYYILKFIVW